LRELSHHFKQGLLPDRFPLPHHPSQDSDYGSVDTTLWYFYALDHYLQATRHYEFLKEVYHLLFESINWYLRGTYYDIHVDRSDGLLQTGKALTWMNALVDGVPITPRQGKAVEVNALWYYALCLIQEWSQTLYRMGHLTRIPAHFQEPLALCKENFQRRFWYEGGYLYDVVDGLESSQGGKGNDASLRPNQLFALSLRYPILDAEYRTSVFDVVTKSLVTPYGLRTLAPDDSRYQGQLGAQQKAQLQALHQGSVWSWLIGPYIDTALALGQPTYLPSFLPAKQKCSPQHQQLQGIQLLEPFLECLDDGLIGMNGGVFDGNAPHASGYFAASAIATSELIRSYDTLALAFSKQRMKVSI
jgi:predicted glycogen debranching enzyme